MDRQGLRQGILQQRRFVTDTDTMGMLSLYDELNSLEDLQRLIDSEARESDILEYKTANAGSRWRSPFGTRKTCRQEPVGVGVHRSETSFSAA
jgi:hypothetical protein